MHLFKDAFEYDDDVSKANTIESNVKVISYTSYKRYGILIANYNGGEFEFKDDGLLYKDILEDNIGKFIKIRFINRIEGVFIFDSMFHILYVYENKYKHYDKWSDWR